MRSGGLGYERLPLFVWAISITAVLLMLSLPVLAGINVPALNLAVSGELCTILKYTDNPEVIDKNSKFVKNLNDCAPGSSNIYNKFPHLGSYLAGLIEGDGSIIVPKIFRDSKNRLTYASIQISFPTKDYPLYSLLRFVIGHGSISKKSKVAAYVYTINNLTGLVKIVNLVNGYLRTPKILDFVDLIKYLNLKSPGLNLVALPTDNSPLDSNAWTAGFIEADGSFQVRTSLNSKYPRLGLSFELTQPRVNHDGHSNYKYMEKIAEFLSVQVNFIRNDRKYPQYRVRTSTVQSNLILSNYLSRYPLRGTKHMDFTDWSLILNYFRDNVQWQKVDHISALKTGMNDSRTNFNWSFLDI